MHFPVPDLERATALYREMLGFAPVFSMSGMWGELQAGDTTVGLHQRNEGTVG